MRSQYFRPGLPGCDRRAWVGSQLFRCKSIDQLLADSENAEIRLKKSLGWLSLTSLGIGAVIGSGIFTIIGTAIAGQKFQASSILNAPLLEYLIHHSASFGRPGAGPAIALSFTLVAIACGFASVCYAELAAMIPIAGSAYTYTYATMGELIAMLLTVLLVRGIRESAETNNVMVLLKIVAILVFVGFASRFIQPANWHPFAPNGWPGILTGGSIVFFTYIGFDSVSTAAEECNRPQRDLPIGIIATLIICTILYVSVVVVLTGLVRWDTLIDDAAPVV